MRIHSQSDLSTFVSPDRFPEFGNNGTGLITGWFELLVVLGSRGVLRCANHGQDIGQPRNPPGVPFSDPSIAEVTSSLQRQKPHASEGQSEGFPQAGTQLL